MEAYRINRFGSVDGIVLRSSEDPHPGPNEVLMRVRASFDRSNFLQLIDQRKVAVQMIALTNRLDPPDRERGMGKRRSAT